MSIFVCMYIYMYACMCIIIYKEGMASVKLPSHREREEKVKDKTNWVMVYPLFALKSSDMTSHHRLIYTRRKIEQEEDKEIRSQSKQ